MLMADRQHTTNGQTRAMLSRFTDLAEAGVTVMLARGDSGGIQHSKTVQSDDLVIIGSSNWTTSSAKNTELSTLIQLGQSGNQAFEVWKTEALGFAIGFKIMTRQGLATASSSTIGPLRSLASRGPVL